MMTQESRFAYPQNQAALINNRTTQQGLPPNKKAMVAWDPHPAQWIQLVNDPSDMFSAHIKNIN